MTERIKLTNENLKNYIFKLESSYLMEEEPLFKQILENQKIVDTLFQFYGLKLRSPEFNHFRTNHNIPLLDTNLKEVQSWINFIIKEGTGKNIEEIWNKENVKN